MPGPSSPKDKVRVKYFIRKNHTKRNLDSKYLNKIYITESETDHTVSALGKTFHKTDIAPITEAQYKALTFDQAGKKRKLDETETPKDSPVTKQKTALKPKNKNSTAERKV